MLHVDFIYSSYQERGSVLRQEALPETLTAIRCRAWEGTVWSQREGNFPYACSLRSGGKGLMPPSIRMANPHRETHLPGPMSS